MRGGIAGASRNGGFGGTKGGLSQSRIPTQPTHLVEGGKSDMWRGGASGWDGKMPKSSHHEEAPLCHSKGIVRRITGGEIIIHGNRFHMGREGSGGVHIAKASFRFCGHLVITTNKKLTIFDEGMRWMVRKLCGAARHDEANNSPPPKWCIPPPYPLTSYDF